VWLNQPAPVQLRWTNIENFLGILALLGHLVVRVASRVRFCAVYGVLDVLLALVEEVLHLIGELFEIIGAREQANLTRELES
jgi:hypothetical protein